MQTHFVRCVKVVGKRQSERESRKSAKDDEQADTHTHTHRYRYTSILYILMEATERQKRKRKLAKRKELMSST